MADTLTAADLHRWYLGPWCEKCGWLEVRGSSRIHKNDTCPEFSREPLWERWPETRPEGLEFWPDGRWGWRFEIDGEDGCGLPVRYAADLCLAGVNKATPYFCSRKQGNMIWIRIGDFEIAASFARAPTIYEAAAIAAHRYRDQQERSHG
jgi:hypothetical protein